MAFASYRLHPLGPKYVRKLYLWNGARAKNFVKATKFFLEDYYLGQLYTPSGLIVNTSGSAVFLQGYLVSGAGSVFVTGTTISSFIPLAPTTFTFSEKLNNLRNNRSIALNIEASLKVAQANQLNMDNFNQKYLIGDTATIQDFGVNQLIWNYYKEKSYENGTSYISPSANSYSTWLSGWINIDKAAQNPNGDGLNGLFPPDANGVASLNMNTSSVYLLLNGEIASTSGGLVGSCNSLVLAIGDSATQTTQLNSSPIYPTALDAYNAAIAYLYGSVNLVKTGRGLIGRRTQNIEVGTSGTLSFSYSVGDAGGNKDSPTFYSNSTDVNGYEGNEKTTFVNSLASFLSSADSNSSYQIHLRNLRDQVRKINNNQNPLFLSAGMSADVTDNATTIDTLLNNLGTSIGHSTDLVASGTAWGYYNFFFSAVGNEGTFDSNLYNLRTLITGTISPLFSTRANTIDDHTSSTFLGTISTKLRKWRYFWVNERLGKPTGSYASYYAIGNAITSSMAQVTNATVPLQTLFGDTRANHLQYIPTPKMLASFMSPLTNPITGAVTKRRAGVAFDGQQHASAYRIYRTPAPPNTALNLIADTTWDESATYYDTQTTIDPKTSFVSNIYIDNSSFSIGQKWLYRVKVVDWNYKVGPDTCMSLFSNLYNTSVVQNYSNSGDSSIRFGTAHPFKTGNYILIQNTPTSNGFYKVINSGDTSIKVTPNHNSNGGTIYLTNSAVFIT